VLLWYLRVVRRVCGIAREDLVLCRSHVEYEVLGGKAGKVGCAVVQWRLRRKGSGSLRWLRCFALKY